GGISSAMNAGLDCMTGEYVTFIDSDDFICKSYVRDMLCMCIKYHCDMAACSPYYGCGNDFHGICEKERIWAYDRVSAFMSRKITSSVVGKLYKAELYATERFPVSDHYNYEDEALIYKLLYQSDHVAVTDRKMYYCYQSPETTARNDRNYMEDDFFEVLENRICYFADKEEELYDLSWEYYGVCMVLAYMKSKRDKLNHNDREEFIQIYKRAFKMINRNRITPISLKLMLSAFYVAPDLSTSIANMFHLRLLLATWDHFLNDRKWVAYLFLLI
ncbi:MAG TPA: glycosyltransferase, partial [Mobilitalea sp.]|nr:glycosyltransferase [Mobilitalea sp.]